MSAYEAALTERTRAHVPYDWAATQHNRANALLALGRLEDDRTLLNEAVATYEAALKIRSRADLPMAWKATWDALGAALVELTGRGDYAAFMRLAGTSKLSDLLALTSQEVTELVEEAD